MKKTKSLLGFGLLSAFIIGLGMVLLVINLNKSVVLSVEPPSDQPSATPAPLILSQVSPDGTHTVSLSTQGDTTEILVNGEVVYRKPVVSGSELLVPFNTWSPDDKYFFLDEVDAGSREYLVMMGNGKYWGDETPYLKVADLFAQAHPESTIVDVTGWAAPTLLILNVKSGNESNISYWFDVTSRKFIRLSNFFY